MIGINWMVVVNLTSLFVPNVSEKSNWLTQWKRFMV